MTPDVSRLRTAGSAGAAGREVTSTSVPSLPFGALPEVPGNLRPGRDAAAAFPTIGGGPNHAQQGEPGHLTQAAADRGPLDRQLLGTQMLGLAALCAAVGVVVARLTLRRHQPPGRHADQPASDKA